MEAIHEILTDLPTNDLSLYIEMGNNAGKSGNIEESIEWYMKGLTKAKEQQDEKSIKKLSALIALSL